AVARHDIGETTLPVCAPQLEFGIKKPGGRGNGDRVLIPAENRGDAAARNVLAGLGLKDGAARG
ncbi:MAG: hypothetical protein AB7H71_18160, partial [Alphaproteobacteria bacterium]